MLCIWWHHSSGNIGNRDAKEFFWFLVCILHICLQDTDDPTVDLELPTIVLPNGCTQPGKGWKDPHANLKVLSMSEQDILTFKDPTYGSLSK